MIHAADIARNAVVRLFAHGFLTAFPVAAVIRRFKIGRRRGRVGKFFAGNVYFDVPRWSGNLPTPRIFKRYACKRSAIIKRRISDKGNAARNDDARKRGTIIERTTADRSNAFGDRYACERGAIIERTTADRDNAVGNFYARERNAIYERPSADIFCILVNRNACNGIIFYFY